MSDDPVTRLAKLRAIADSADIQAQLNLRAGTRPILTILIRAQDEAAEALSALVWVTPEKVEEIRGLQNEVRRYHDLVRWLKDLATAGIEHDREITDMDREEMIDLLSQTPEGLQEATELGLIHQNLTDA